MYATAPRSTDTKIIRRTENGNGTSTIHCELLQPFDFSGGKLYNLVKELSDFVKTALINADTLRPQRADFNAYNLQELDNWGIHGFLHIQLYDEKNESWVPIDLRKGTPLNSNPAAKKREVQRDSLFPIYEHAIHISESERLGAQWGGVAVTLDASAAPIIEKYSKPGDQKKRSGEVAQQVTNVLWTYVKIP